MYGKVIKDARKKLGMTQEDLANKIDVTRVAITHYEKESNPPTFENIIKLASALNIDEQDLFDHSKRSRIAKNEILKNKELYAPMFPEIQSRENMIPIPAIYAGAGAAAILDHHDAEMIYVEKRLIPDDKKSLIDNKNTTIIRVVGDSMSPKINENDVIFIEMLNERHFTKKDGIYLIRYGDAIQIKYVQFLGNGHANIISANSIYPVINTKNEGSDWEILGKPFMRWGVEYFSNFEIE